MPASVGSKDYPQRIFIPDRLYGREKELRQLRQAFERVAGQLVGEFAVGEKSRSELVLVKGNSGTGKSSLVLDVRDLVEERGGCFGEFVGVGGYEFPFLDLSFDTEECFCQSLENTKNQPSSDHLTGLFRD